jgi:hypothetical protein
VRTFFRELAQMYVVFSFYFFCRPLLRDTRDPRAEVYCILKDAPEPGRGCECEWGFTQELHLHLLCMVCGGGGGGGGGGGVGVVASL